MGVVDYMCGFFYEIESRRFKNTLDETIHYGWEEIVKESSLDFGAAQDKGSLSPLPFPPIGQNDECPY